MKFNEYWDALWRIKIDCNVEQYYDEIIRPLLVESASKIDNVKVVPTFDTRCRGKNKKKYKCVTGEIDQLVWPDYVFVPYNYCHDNPVYPYVKVEFKVPNIGKLEENGTMKYFPIYYKSKKLYDELKAELIDCPLIVTDGITWLFLKEQGDVDNIKSIEACTKNILVDRFEKYHSGNYVKVSRDASQIYDKLKESICDFIRESELYQVINMSSKDNNCKISEVVRK